jgi:hypothetical protein
MRRDERLLVVGDATPGGYFEFVFPKATTVFSIDPDRCRWVSVRRPLLAQDLEGIDVLADGRVVLLSEDFATLIGIDGVVVQYDARLRELANRGLEGVGVRGLADGDSRVAVVWEGGLPSSNRLSSEVEAGCVDPIVLFHDVRAGESDLRVLLADADEEGGGPLQVRYCRLAVGQIPQADGLCLRAPDLVWNEGEAGAELIVLLSSERSSLGDRYDAQWLQRFRVDGTPIGEPFDLKGQLPDGLDGAVNWEGLGWFVHGGSVVLIHDTPPGGTPKACVVRIPSSW